MGKLQSVLYWIAALDPALTWDQRLGRWANIVQIAGVPVTLLVGIGASYLFDNAWVGVVVGLGIWILALNGFVALWRLRSNTPSKILANSTREHTAAQETEGLRLENERLKADKAALEKELEKARSAADKRGNGTTPTDRAERSTSATPAETPAMLAVSATPDPPIGATVRMESGARITVHSYESPIPPPSWFQDLSPGHELLAIDVEAYAGSNPEDYLDHIQSSDFKLQMPDNIRLRPALSAKEPALLNNPLAPNDEIRGWITFEVPKDEKPKFVVYSRGTSVVKWVIPQWQP